MTDSITTLEVRAAEAYNRLRAAGLDTSDDNIDAAVQMLKDEEAAVAPNGYAPGLQLRTTTAPPSTFEADYKAARLRDLEATRTALDAKEAAPRLTTAETLVSYRPPNGYQMALDKEKK